MVSLLLLVGAVVLLAVLWLFFCSSASSKKQAPGKTVWLLWLQGWDAAPWLVQQVRASWERLNPEWTVLCLDESSVHDYVQVELPREASPAAKSDLVRVALLSQCGGVWADATMLCLVPLDTWVYEALEPAGFWMYEGERGPASWFMISLRGHHIAMLWADAAASLWRVRAPLPASYFWLDDLFLDLLAHSPVFAEAWAQVPRIHCEAPGQAHALAGRCARNDPEVKALLRAQRPYVLKLNRHEGITPETHPDANAVFAIGLALDTPHPLPWPRHALCDGLWPPLPDKVMVAADCGLHAEVATLASLCRRLGFQLMVYDKCAFGAKTPVGVWRRPLANLGRDMHTYLHFVATHYHHLPETLVFTATNLSKHARYARLLELLQRDDEVCNTSPLDAEENFELTSYEGTPLAPASIRPFRTWFERGLGAQWDPKAGGPCWNGLMRTGRTRLLRHPRDLYQRLCREAAEANSTEVGHYLERAMMHIF